MKARNGDKELRDLFRNKLESAEVVPSPSVSKIIMKKLAVRRFLRFNAARFNAWYAGAIIATGTIIAVILSSNPRSDDSYKEPALTKEPDKQIINEKIREDDIITEEKGDTESKSVIGIQEEKASYPKITPDDQETVVTEQKTGPVNSLRIPDISGETIVSGRVTTRNNLKSTVVNKDSYIAASVIEGCAPLKVIFRSMIAPEDSCKWTFGDGGYSYDRNTEWLFDIEGDYRVDLDIYTADGKRNTSSVDIIVHPSPEARFEIIPENAIIPDDEIVFLNYSTNAVRYKWDFGDGTTSELFEPRHAYNKYNNYDIQLIAYSEYGCSDSLMIYNAFSGSGYFVDFPNAFIPNPNGPSGGYYSPRSDESAYVFHPVYSGVASYQLRIFSRLGILIFESNDINIGWDGYYKGALCEPGVYIYKVRGIYINGEPFTKMGDVTLLKN